MEPVAGARTFSGPAEAYDRFMGRYSMPLAAKFAAFADVQPGHRVLDVGCGPGALTTELVRRLGAGAVAGCDPSPGFVAECRRRCPGVDVRGGTAENLPFEAGAFDAVLAQLVLHFVSRPGVAAAEMARVGVRGSVVAACVWDFGGGMQMLRAFWEAALSLDPSAPAEVKVMRFGRDGELAQWLSEAGFSDVLETTLRVSSTYADFDELWSGFEAGIGPAGSYTVSLPADHGAALRFALYERVGSPAGSFALDSVARAARAVSA